MSITAEELQEAKTYENKFYHIFTNPEQTKIDDVIMFVISVELDKANDTLFKIKWVSSENLKTYEWYPTTRAMKEYLKLIE